MRSLLFIFMRMIFLQRAQTKCIQDHYMSDKKICDQDGGKSSPVLTQTTLKFKVNYY